MEDRYMQQDDLQLILDGKMKPTDRPLALLQNITDNFSEAWKIGEGGFGMVYKGVLRNGNVAVKKIMNSHTIDEKLFRREVTSLMKVNHHNAVRFLGFCSNTEHKAMQINGELIFAERRQRLLCFEYISNGSLDKHITDELRGLEWSTRYHIIKGICEGLHHLHKENGIIHMDLKPANILLNDHMVPKITDFGLSRLEGNSATLTTHRYLSLGYCAPEYLFDGKMSLKSDMYSLGVIIMELVTGEKGIPNNKNDVLRRWRHRWNKSATGTPLCYHQVTKCIDIGVRCQAKPPYERPFIWEIIGDINEIGNTDRKISSVIESTVGQVSPYSDNDMLGIEPLKLRFPGEFNRKVSCSLELTNETDTYIAFSIETMSPVLPYCTWPEKGTVPPRSKCGVNIKLEPHEKSLREMQEPCKFIVRSTKVNKALTSEDISKDIFNKERGKVVDKVNVYVVFDTQLQAPCISEEQEEDLPAPTLTVSGIENVNHPEISDVPESSANTAPAGETDSGVISVSNESIEVHVTKVDAATLTVFSDALSQPPSLSSEEPNEEFSHVPLPIPDIDNEETGQACDRPQSSAQSLSGDGQNISVKNTSMLYCLDINPVEPWIITGHIFGDVRIWNYDTQATMDSLAVTKRIVDIVKFIARKQWFVAASDDGFIHVYKYGTEMQKIFYKKQKWQKITSFRANTSFLSSLVVHPTHPYVLLSGNGCPMKLWDWKKGWKCTQTFDDDSNMTHGIAFNPKDTNIFASASENHRVKVWSLDSPKCTYTLAGHSDGVKCLSYFSRDDQQYLISGSNDGTAKIWDMQRKECVQTLQALSPVVSVLSHPYQPVLIMGLEDGTVHFWRSTDFRLQKILNNGYNREVRGLAFLIGSKRIAIGQLDALSIVDIDNEEYQ